MGAAALRPFLLAHKGYPRALMANEVQVQLNGTKKRCDTVLYRRDLTARMIVEYKAPEIEIPPKVFDQITRYNMVLKVDYLIVSNRLQHYCCRMNSRAQQLYFSAGYTRVSKLIGGATNSPLASLISSHHIPCVICGR